MARRGGRWALSFADLSLLLLGFFVLLQARPEPVRMAAGLRAALGDKRPTFEQQAAALFEPGEAILRPKARGTLRTFARGANGIAVASRGTEHGTTRFDGWELAAARTAAIARELTAAGVPEGHVSVAIEPATGGGQQLLLVRS